MVLTNLVLQFLLFFSSRKSFYLLTFSRVFSEAHQFRARHYLTYICRIILSSVSVNTFIFQIMSGFFHKHFSGHSHFWHWQVVRASKAGGEQQPWWEEARSRWHPHLHELVDWEGPKLCSPGVPPPPKDPVHLWALLLPSRGFHMERNFQSRLRYNP